MISPKVQGQLQNFQKLIHSGFTETFLLLMQMNVKTFLQLLMLQNPLISRGKTHYIIRHQKHWKWQELIPKFLYFFSFPQLTNGQILANFGPAGIPLSRIQKNTQNLSFFDSRLWFGHFSKQYMSIKIFSKSVSNQDSNQPQNYLRTKNFNSNHHTQYVYSKNWGQVAEKLH